MGHDDLGKKFVVVSDWKDDTMSHKLMSRAWRGRSMFSVDNVHGRKAVQEELRKHGVNEDGAVHNAISTDKTRDDKPNDHTRQTDLTKTSQQHPLCSQDNNEGYRAEE